MIQRTLTILFAGCVLLVSGCDEDPASPSRSRSPAGELEITPESVAPGTVAELRLAGTSLAPEAVAWEVDGGRLLSQRGNPVQWRTPDVPGTYAVRVWLSGGKTVRRIDRAVGVGTEFGVLEVESTPGGAEILIDGAPTGRRTPFTFYRQPSGLRVVSLRGPSLFGIPREQAVRVDPAAPVRASFRVVLFGTLSVLTVYTGTSVPIPEALVSVDSLNMNTDERGEARFDSLDVGEHDLTVSRAQFDPYLVRVEVPAGTLRVSAPLTSFDLTRTVEGRVRNTRGEGLGRGRVILLDPDGSASGIADSLTPPEGSYALELVPPGRRRIRAEADYYTTRVDSLADEGDPTRLDWTLTAAPLDPPAGITARPLDPDLVRVEWDSLGYPTGEWIEVLKLADGDAGEVSLGLVPLDSTTFLHEGAPAGSRLRYRLRVWNFDDVTGPFSFAAFAVTPRPMDPMWTFTAPHSDPSGLACVAGTIWSSDAWNPRLALSAADETFEDLDLLDTPDNLYRGLHYDGSVLWAVRKADGAGPGAIDVLDPDSRPLARVASGPAATSEPLGIATDGVHLWTCNRGTGYLYRHAMAPPFTVLDSIPAPGDNPSGLAWDGSRLWSCDDELQLLFRHRPNVADIEAIYAAPAPQPRGLTFDEGGHLWVATWSNRRIYRHAHP
jgi:hypothetical protein